MLLDLKLQKLAGLRRVRANERTKLLPVIIPTSRREEKDLVARYTNGANSYIVEPVDSANFAEGIEQLGLYWLVLNESPSRWPAGLPGGKGAPRPGDGRTPPSYFRSNAAMTFSKNS